MTQLLTLTKTQKFPSLAIEFGALQPGVAAVQLLDGQNGRVVGAVVLDPPLERLHPDHGEKVEKDKEHGGVGDEGGHDVHDGVEDGLEHVEAGEDFDDSEDP